MYQRKFVFSDVKVLKSEKVVYFPVNLMRNTQWESVFARILYLYLSLANTFLLKFRMCCLQNNNFAVNKTCGYIDGLEANIWKKKFKVKS